MSHMRQQGLEARPDRPQTLNVQRIYQQIPVQNPNALALNTPFSYALSVPSRHRARLLCAYCYLDAGSDQYNWQLSCSIQAAGIGLVPIWMCSFIQQNALEFEGSFYPGADNLTQTASGASEVKNMPIPEAYIYHDFVVELKCVGGPTGSAGSSINTIRFTFEIVPQ